MSLLLDLAYILFLTAVSPVLLWRSLRQGKYREVSPKNFSARFPEPPKTPAA